MKKYLLSTVAMSAVAAVVAWSVPVSADDFHGNGFGFGGQGDNGHHGSSPNEARTATPIKHLVVIFNENRSFDHYFATYPTALNPEGEPRFEPNKNTPTQINNLLSSPALLDNNPNANPNIVPSNVQ